MSKKIFNFECYECNPFTKEEGWNIVFVSVFANDKQEAKEVLKTKVPNFDTIILFNYGGVDIKDGSVEAKIYANGEDYFYTNYHGNPCPRSYWDI